MGGSTLSFPIAFVAKFSEFIAFGQYNDWFNSMGMSWVLLRLWLPEARFQVVLRDMGNAFDALSDTIQQSLKSSFQI